MGEHKAIYDARSLGWPTMLILGLQHFCAMFGATVIVPILVNSYFHGEGLSVQVTLFCAGFGTLLFHLCSKMKVPAFLGSSFAFLGGFAAVAELPEFEGMSYGEKLPYACGGIVVAGALYLVLAGLIKIFGVKRVMHYLPPVVTGPIIMCIGFSLIPSAVSNASANWPLALVALVTVVAFYIWGKGMFKIIPILMGVAVAYVVAIIMQACGITNADGSVIIDTATLASSALIGVPQFQLAKFNFSAILVMAPIAIASMMEHVGDISAISATTGRNFIEDPGLARTLVGDGLATSLAAFFGGPANTTYGENTGVLELSKVYDPLVIRIAAVFSIILSFIPKLSAIFGTMPTAIVGGISLVLYGMISVIGLRNIAENQVDFKQPRNLIVAGAIFAISLGLGSQSISLGKVTLTSLALASIVGILLNTIFPGKDYEFGRDPKKDEYRGMHV